MSRFIEKIHKPYDCDVYNLIYALEMWDTGSLSATFGIDVSEAQLQRDKEIIYDEIKEWIFSNPYPKDPYIVVNARRGLRLISKEEIKPEYDMFVAVWLMHAFHAGQPDLSLDKYDQKLRLHANKLFKEGGLLGNKPMKRVLHRLLRIYRYDQLLHPERIPIYRECIKKVVRYMKYRDYSFVSPTKDENYKKIFDADYCVAYNVYIGLGRFYGFDPATFRQIDEAVAFNPHIEEGRFARHEPFGPSLSPFDHILTWASPHSKIWNHLPHDQQLDIIIGMERLVRIERYDDDGNLLDLTRDDIEFYFDSMGADWVYKNWGDGGRYGDWFDDPDFQGALSRFEQMRREFRNYPYKEFIRRNFPTAYNRFYVNILSRSTTKVELYFLLHDLHSIGDANLIEDILSIDYDQTFIDILQSYGYKW